MTNRSINVRTPSDTGKVRLLLLTTLLLGAGVAVLLLREGPSVESERREAPRTDAALESLQHRYGHVRATDVASVVDDAQALVTADPEHVAARNFLALVLSEAGRLEQAYACMTESLALDQVQPAIHFGAGVLATQLDRFDAARQHYLAAVRQDSGMAIYRVHLAMIEIKQQAYANAEQRLLEAIQLDSSLADAYFGLAELYFVQNKRELALQQIEKAIERMPVGQRDKQVKFLRKKAWILRRSNRWADALATLKRLTSIERRTAEVIEEMALCLRPLGREIEAAELYEAAWASDPVNVDLVIGAARYRLAAGDRERARSHVATLRTLKTDVVVLAELEAALNGDAPERGPSSN